jgi:hypothetical protein
MKTLARDGDSAEILRRLRTVRPDSPRQWGKMSAHQMICHLTDSARMALGEKMVSHIAGPLQRTVVKWIALYAPLRWPPGLLTRPEIDQVLGGTCPGDFAADLAELEAFVGRMAAGKGRVAWAERHPIFGRMSEAAWLRWGYLHMDHHLRQFGA